MLNDKIIFLKSAWNGNAHLFFSDVMYILKWNSFSRQNKKCGMGVDNEQYIENCLDLKICAESILCSAPSKTSYISCYYCILYYMIDRQIDRYRYTVDIDIDTADKLHYSDV